MTLLCIGMGDTNAVDVAEQTHLGILDKHGALRRECLLCWGDEFPDGDLLQGIYIDDGCIIGICESNCTHLPGPDSQLARDCVRALELEEVEVSHKKGFGALAENAPNEGDEVFVTWGTRVHSPLGLVGVECTKRSDIACVLLRAVALPLTERSLLEHLISLLTHPLVHRRPLLAYMHRVHKFIMGLAYGDLVPWPADIADELVMCSVCLIVAEAHIRWRVSERITLTDATQKRGGAVYARTSVSLANALYRASEAKGFATSLRQEHFTVPEIAADPQLADLFRTTPWRLSRSHDFAEVQHVNLQELGEIVTEALESANISLEPLRQVNGSDSSVSIHASAKGRSPSLLLNGVLRQLAAVSIFCEREQVNIKVDTKDNVADDPSRDLPVREPESKPPRWLAPHLRSELEADPEVRPLRTRIGARFRMFREVFAGCARLTFCVRDAGLACARPMEPYPSPDNSKRSVRAYFRCNDVMEPDVLCGLRSDIIAGFYLCLHFGICCGGWGKANTMNGGTRTISVPLGGAYGRQRLPREELANLQAIVVSDLCRLLHSLGLYFSIENPYDSFLWSCPAILSLMEFIGADCTFVQFDQCTYGLQLPGASSTCFCRKRTCMLSNMPELKGLASACAGIGPLHQHDHAWGSIRIEGKTYSKAAAAGRYPLRLCRRYADLVHGAISRRFFHGASPWRRSEAERC